MIGLSTELLAQVREEIMAPTAETTQPQYDSDTVMNESLNPGVMVLDKAKFPSINISRTPGLSQHEERRRHRVLEEEEQNTNLNHETETETDRKEDQNTQQKEDHQIIVNTKNIEDSNGDNGVAATDTSQSTKSEDAHWVSRIMTYTNSTNDTAEKSRDAMEDLPQSMPRQDRDPAFDDVHERFAQQRDDEDQSRLTPLARPQKKDNDQEETVHNSILGLLQSHRLDGEPYKKNRRGSAYSKKPNITMTMSYNNNNNHNNTLDTSASEHSESKSCSSSVATDDETDDAADDEEFWRTTHQSRDDNGSSFVKKPSPGEDHQDIDQLEKFKNRHQNNSRTQQGNNPHRNTQNDNRRSGLDQAGGIDSRHQILFENFDRTIERCCVEEEYKDDVYGKSKKEDDSFLLSLMEIRELTKLCFAAIAIVFSSKRTFHNTGENNESDRYPFTTIMKDDKYEKSGTSVTKEDSSYDSDSSSSYSIEDGGSITKPSVNTNTRAAAFDDDDAGSANRPSIPLCVVKMFWKELLQRRCKRRPIYSEDVEDVDDIEIGDNSTEEHDGNDNDANGGIPMSEENVSIILDKVLHTLDNELTFLDVVSYRCSQNTNIKDNCDDSFVSRPLPCQVVHVKEQAAAQEQDSSDKAKNVFCDDGVNYEKDEVIRKDDSNFSTPAAEDLSKLQKNNDIQCVKVNHNVHLLYGRHMAKKFTKAFTFRHKKHGPPTKHRYSTGCYDNDPEVAMNAVMAAACSTCIELANPIILQGKSLPPTLQLQYEYSLQMLPWHLMQALQYKYVVDVLTDENFVCRRIELMEFCAASSSHISDVEDLFSRTTIVSATAIHLEDTTHLKFADVNMTEVFLDSYRLFGDTIQVEEAKKLKRPINEEEVGSKENIKEEKAEKEEEEEKKNDSRSVSDSTTTSKKDNLDTSELKYILEISLALRSMGDSLFMHGLKNEAMAFFYRALIRYEHTHDICTHQTQMQIANSVGDMSVGGVSCTDDPVDYTSDMDLSNVTFDNCSDLDKTRSSNNDEMVSMSSIQFFMGEILSRIASVYQSMLFTTKVDAMLCYDRALSFYSRQNSDKFMVGVAQTLSSIGEIHLDMSEYASALSCFDESLLLLRSQQDDNDHENDTGKNSNEIASTLAFMGTVRKEMDMPNEALDYFSQALYEKVIVCGQFHPEVGFLQHSIAKIYSELNEAPKALIHFDEALRVRRASFQSALLDHNHGTVLESCSSSDQGGERADIVKENELLVADTLLCVGTVYEASKDYENAFTNLLENALIHWSHLINLAADHGLLMINDIVKLMQDNPDGTQIISNLFENLTVALYVGNQILTSPSDGTTAPRVDKADHLFEVKGQVADLEFFIGMICGAQYFHNTERGNRDKAKFIEEGEAEAELSNAKEHLEQSLYWRKKRDGAIHDLDNPDDTSNDNEEIIIAFILYELGKLFSFSALKENHSKPQPYAYSSLFFSTKKLSGQEGVGALSYFEEARSILQGNAGLVDAVDSLILVDNPWAARLQKTPDIYEDMLQTMAILYRKLDEYNKSVECYNEVSILLTRMGLGDSPDAGLEESKVHNQKEKVAIASQSIGDILSDTGEYSRAIKSYEEALQLRRLLDKDSLDVADTLCRKGMVYLKLKEWGQTVLNFDEALRIRVDRLPEDHQDIAVCFHQIGKGYEGHQKFEQALEYYKKSQRIVSKHSVEKNLHAADLLYDLGCIVLVMSNLSESMICTAPSDDDVSLALSCLTQSRDIYTSNFGNTALEVGNTLSLLGTIYAKFGDYKKAVETYEDALTIYRNTPQDQSSRVAKTLKLIGVAILKSEADDSDNSKCLQHLQLAQQIHEDKGETNSEEFIDVLFYLGAAYTKLDAIVEAITSYEDALTVACVVLGRDHIRISVILEKLGSCLIRTREHKEAMEFLEEGIEVRKKHARCNDLVSADIHFAMGIIHCESRKLNDAINCYEEAIKIRRVLLGENHVDVAQILNNIGSVFARNGEYQRALKPWQRALEMYRHNGLEEEHQKIVITLGNIALSKNLVSVKAKSGLESSVRKLGSW